MLSVTLTRLSMSWAVAVAQRWSAYKEVNIHFAKKVVETVSGHNEDLVWVHDYPLLLLPQILCGKHISPANIGFFLHTPFPSSEVSAIGAVGGGMAAVACGRLCCADPTPPPLEMA
jgi:trehalose-6-phosphate synthase